MPKPEPAPPYDPWAPPGAPVGPAPGAPAPVGPPPAAPAEPVVPAAAGPAPAAGGWASVPPGALSGFQPGFPYAPAPPRLNGFAIGSLVTAAFALWPIALVLAVVALVQIPRRRERGVWLAVAGIVMSALSVPLTVMAVNGELFEPGESRNGSAGRAPKGAVSWLSLKAGDCYDPADGKTDGKPGPDDTVTVHWVVKVPCTAPHHAELAGTAQLAGGDGYPGERAVREQAAALCAPVLSGYALDGWAVPEGMQQTYLYPTSGLWYAGERDLYCSWEDTRTQHKGSVRTDRSGLSTAQLGYLEALRILDDAYAREPEAELAEAPERYRTWASELAAAARREAGELSRTSTPWPAGAKEPLAQAARLQLEAAEAWEAAGTETDPGRLRRALARGDGLAEDSRDDEAEIRRELGLPTGSASGSQV
ncbi:septum formation family protein [Kitasatospora sp. NPDC054939]